MQLHNESCRCAVINAQSALNHMMKAELVWGTTRTVSKDICILGTISAN